MHDPTLDPESDIDDRMPIWVAAALLLVVFGNVIDLFFLDGISSWLSFHAVFEVVVIGLGLALAVLLGQGWRRKTRQVVRLRRWLDESRADQARWRAMARPALADMASAIDRQFAEWQLTPAEREVALALLKGHSHKAIAARSGREAQTVRQHATAIYQKAGLSGRAELAAYFLEDLTLP